MADQTNDDPSSTPEGLLRCLLLLAHEAGTLSLSRTVAALQEAVAICRAEVDLTPSIADMFGRPALIH